MSVGDGAPPKITGADILGRFERCIANASMFLVGNTTPGNAASMLPPTAVAFAVTDSPKTPEYQPAPLTPPKLTIT